MLFYKRQAYVELLSHNTVRLTTFSGQKTFNLVDGFQYFNLISLTKIKPPFNEMKLIEDNKFILRIKKEGLAPARGYIWL